MKLIKQKKQLVPILPLPFFLEKREYPASVQFALSLARGSTRQLPVGLLTGLPHALTEQSDLEPKKACKKMNFSVDVQPSMRTWL